MLYNATIKWYYINRSSNTITKRYPGYIGTPPIYC